MKKRKFEVKIHHTGFCIYQVEANSEDEAVKKARKFKINSNEILSNLENWEEADFAEEIKYENNRK